MTTQEKRNTKKQSQQDNKIKQQTIAKQTLVMKVFGGIIVVSAIIGSLIFMDSGPSLPPFALTEISEYDHIKGNKDAKASYYHVVKDIEEIYGKDIAIIYRHFPLISIHPYAETAARASEVAAKYGKFWPMHDELFENQREWSSGNIESFFSKYAEKIGITADVFIEDLKSTPAKKIVRHHYQSGVKAGLNSTPTFILNGEKLPGLNPDDLKKVIENAINKT